jgi:hypothetical protein
MEDPSDFTNTNSLRTRQGVSCRLERLFASACLPSTMQLALRFHLDLVKQLAPIHPEWPFEDRILLWLLPNMENESLAFHDQTGGDITTCFAEHQLKHLDEVLAQDLGRRLDG